MFVIGLPLEFGDICHTFGDVSTSGLDGYFRLSIETTVFEIAMADSLRFSAEKKQI